MPLCVCCIYLHVVYLYTFSHLLAPILSLCVCVCVCVCACVPHQPFCHSFFYPTPLLPLPSQSWGFLFKIGHKNCRLITNSFGELSRRYIHTYAQFVYLYVFMFKSVVHTNSFGFTGNMVNKVNLVYLQAQKTYEGRL